MEKSSYPRLWNFGGLQITGMCHGFCTGWSSMLYKEQRMSECGPIPTLVRTLKREIMCNGGASGWMEWHWGPALQVAAMHFWCRPLGCVEHCSGLLALTLSYPSSSIVCHLSSVVGYPANWHYPPAQQQDGLRFLQSAYLECWEICETI